VYSIGMVRQETWSYSTSFGKCINRFQFYDVLSFDSTVVIYVLINISSSKLNNQIFQNIGAQSA